MAIPGRPGTHDEIRPRPFRLHPFLCTPRQAGRGLLDLIAFGVRHQSDIGLVQHGANRHFKLR